MRIGIDYRILAVGPELFRRGIPRYTQQQLRAVLEIDTENEYVLLCNSGSDLSLIDRQIREAPNVAIEIFGAHPPAAPPLGDEGTLLRQAEIYLQWVSSLDFDLFHITAPFLFDRPILIDFDVCPMVASFYDLIPLIFPAQYLSGWWQQQYLRTVALLRKATGMVAISEAAKTDAVTFLGFPADRIDVAWPIADECFRPLSRPSLESAVAALRGRLRLPDQYVLTVSHLHHTKNLHTLLRGYALLPPALRAELPLVVCCHLDEHGVNLMQRKAGELGITDDVVLTGMVSDEELTALYNAATVVVHPSRYEGFGLPVVEAMRCGAPVITTTASSLPEAGGGAAVLVDPDDAPGFAAAIAELHADPDRRGEMRVLGLAHSARFNREQLARRTLESYQAAVASPEPAGVRPRLAIWTPLPPQQSGISDYSVELLGQLRHHYDVEVFVDDGCLPPPSILLQYRVQHFSGFERRQSQAPFDAVVYQMGASVFHGYMYDPLRKHPGVVVLHDLIWSHVLYTLACDAGDIDIFRRQITELEGDAARAEFDEVYAMEPVARVEPLNRFLTEHRMLKDIVDRSVAQIVHLQPAAIELKQLHDNANVFTVPMGVADPCALYRPADVRRTRSRLGISNSTFLVGTFGIVHETKRIHECVVALAQLVQRHPDAVLIVVGRALAQPYVDRLEAVAEALGVPDKVRLLGHVEREEFDRYMLACDAVINLRASTTAHMSATLMRAIAAGRPLIMTDLPEWADIPANCALRVPADGDGSGLVTEHLCRLVEEPHLRYQMSEEARRFYSAEGSVEAMAAGYVDVLDKTGAGPRTRAGRAGDTDPDFPDDVRDLRFNKVCEVEDFHHPELIPVIRDVCSYKLQFLPPEFPKGAEHRKDWEVAMAVRTLRHFGALTRDSVILGVAAGAEDTSFFLTREAKQVFATDRYLASGEWEPTAPLSMLIQPRNVAGFDFDANRLVVQHMDGRYLRYPDNLFDGIFSSGSIEHFGDFEDVASAAYEMGRVLKPGGILSLSTEIRLGGPPGGIGWPGLTLLFSVENLKRFIVDASGLEPVDELDLDVSEQTLSGPRDLTLAIQEHLAAAARGGDPRENYAAWEFPHVVLVHEGYVFTSVHLALRKPLNYPRLPNAWAKPSPEKIAAIEEYNQQLVAQVANGNRPAPAPAPAPPQPVVTGDTSWDEAVAVVTEQVSRLASRHVEIDRQVSDFDHLLSEIDSYVGRVDEDAAKVRQQREQLEHNALDVEAWAESLAQRAGADVTLDRAAAEDWKCSRVVLQRGIEFDVVVDPRVGDQVTVTLSMGRSLDEPLLDLMLDMVGPGDKILDLGAHVGTFSLAAAAVGAHSLAVEASPQNAALLRASAARNGFRHIRVIEAVASDRPGKARFHAQGPWGQVRPASENAADVVTAALSVDALLDQLSWRPLSFVKMDVEGWELHVLDGMEELLGDAEAPPLLYECNGHTLLPYDATPEGLIGRVARLGYTSYLVEPNRLVRVAPDEFQPQTLVDYLAVKQSPRLVGWRVEPQMTFDERVSRVVTDCTHANFNHRVYMARALSRAGADLLDHPSVREVMRGLREDPVDAVRAAMGRSSALPAPAPGGSG